MRNRRSDHDVTNTVRVSDPVAVRDAVLGLMHQTYPYASFRALEQAFTDFARLFRGEYPGFHGCDTLYHDQQHTLDMTLAMARLIEGHERHVARADRIGPRRAMVGLITALFHDAGYLRRTHDTRHTNGAEYTLVHVSRSAQFLERYLPSLGLAGEAPIAARIVHYTGYEIHPENIEVEDRKYRSTGWMLGTADLIAQMADRCYLEKCRDRLYREFVLGGVAAGPGAKAAAPDRVVYRSPQELLRRTPEFYAKTSRERLDGAFQSVHRYAAAHFGGRNLYLQEIQRSLRHLDRILASGNWRLLRRRPPLFTAATLARPAPGMLAARCPPGAAPALRV